MDGLDYLYKNYGKSLRKQHAPLPPRDNVIEFDIRQDPTELECNLNLHGCPKPLHAEVRCLVTEHWDVFCEKGLRKPIRGFTFQIDTGNSPPVCCHTPRYGPHESKVMRKLVENLDDNGWIEDDDGPWGAIIVLAAKTHQENVPWDQFQWHLCVSYRRLNQVTRPFKYPIPRCNDAVKEIDTEAKFFIAIDLHSGYWQIVAEPEARAQLAFFTPDGKKRWKVMPMGALNSTATFVAMMTTLQKEWEAKASKLGISGCGFKVIVDDVLLFGREEETLLRYFRVVLDMLKHHRATLKLKKCSWFQSSCKFVGMDVGAGDNQPASSKFEAIHNLETPKTFADLCMLIGLFGFYSKFLPLYELYIHPWRELLTLQPKPGEATMAEEKQ